MPTVVESAHRKVITAIGVRYANGAPFAIWELERVVNVSKSSIIRVLRQLVKLNYVLHSKKAYAGKHYRVAARWTDVIEVTNTFEIAKALKI